MPENARSLVEFGAHIDDALIDRVQALDRALMQEGVPGIVETVPTYRALMVHYDPLVLPRSVLVGRIAHALRAPPAALEPGHLWHVPACYDPDLAEDLGVISTATGVAPERIGRCMRVRPTGWRCTASRRDGPICPAFPQR